MMNGMLINNVVVQRQGKVAKVCQESGGGVKCETKKRGGD